MKTNVFTILALFVFILSEPLTAQVEKGKILVGAKSDFSAFFKNTKDEITVDGNTTEHDGPTTNQFGLTPTVGYFFADGFAGGLFMDLGISNQKRDEVLEDGTTESLKNNSTSFSMGPFLRYYLDMEKVKPFAHLQVGFGSSNLKYDMVDYDFSDPLNPKVVIEEHELKYGLSSWEIGAGAAFFITNSVAIDVMLGYNSNTRKRKYEDSDNENKTRTGGFGLDVGFSIIIP